MYILIWTTDSQSYIPTPNMHFNLISCIIYKSSYILCLLIYTYLFTHSLTYKLAYLFIGFERFRMPILEKTYVVKIHVDAVTGYCIVVKAQYKFIKTPTYIVYWSTPVNANHHKKEQLIT